ncbi:MAG: hypothetical protein E7353_00645 [Clostridiales bacterium]|nr:hypothetical protein [Clostridiales bacterium]
MFLSVTGISNAALDILIGVLLTLLTVAVLFISVYFIIKYAGKEKGANVLKLLVVVLVIGFLVRILLSIAVLGHKIDFRYVIQNTLEDPDYRVGDATEPPSLRLYPFTYYAISMFASPLLNAGLSYDNVIVNMFIKMPFMIADIVTAFLMYRAGKRFVNEYVGVILASLVCFCPIFLFASSLWGSIVCLLIPIFLGAFLCLVEKKYIPAILIADLALITAKEGMIILPVMFAYFLIVWIKSVYDYAKGNKASTTKNVKSTTSNYNTFVKKQKESLLNIVLIPLTAVLGQVLIYLIALPYLEPIKNLGSTYADFVELFFIMPIRDSWYFGENALNIYAVFGFNTERVVSKMNQMLIAVIFAVFIAIITGIVYFIKKNRAVVLAFGTYAIFTVCTYFVGFTALSIIPVLGMLLLSFVTTKDKRFFRSFCVTVILLIILVSIIYVKAGYYNTLHLSQLGSDYTGGTWLNVGSFKVVMIILSVLQVLNHIYLTFTTFDITINNRVRKFTLDEAPTFKKVMKEVFTNRK